MWKDSLCRVWVATLASFAAVLLVDSHASVSSNVKLGGLTNSSFVCLEDAPSVFFFARRICSISQSGFWLNSSFSVFKDSYSARENSHHIFFHSVIQHKTL